MQPQSGWGESRYGRLSPKHDDTYAVPVRRKKLSHELFHGLSPEEFDREAKSLADAEAMTPQVRARLEAQLIERLKTPIDTPSWGPDWVKRGERVSAANQHRRKGSFAWFGKKDEDGEEDEDATPDPLSAVERDDADIIMRNMDGGESRQVAHYRPLYVAALALAVVIALLAMFVDYQIIRGDVWTRALSNEFMVVPASLQSTVIFKSLQVIFAVLIVHFFLKITGVYGRNTMIAAAFVMALVMIGCLGYLVAYNNMAGGTSATLEQPREDGASGAGSNSIDALFNAPRPATDPRLATGDAGLRRLLARPAQAVDGLAGGRRFLFWLAFASVIFFIVTTVAALYMLTVENNVRNLHIARDYKHRQRPVRPAPHAATRRQARRQRARMKVLLAAVTAIGLTGGGVMAVHATRDADIVMASLNDEGRDRAPAAGHRARHLQVQSPDRRPAIRQQGRVPHRHIVRRLGMASEVHVRTFGSYDAASNNFAYDALISSRTGRTTWPRRSRS